MGEGAHVSMVTAGGSGETSQQMAPCDRDSQLLWGQEGGDRPQGYSPKAHSAFTRSALAKCLPGSVPTVTGTEDSTAPQRCPTRQRATPTAPLTQVRASELDGPGPGSTWGPEPEGCTWLLQAATAHPWGPPQVEDRTPPTTENIGGHLGPGFEPGETHLITSSILAPAPPRVPPSDS